MLQVGHLHARLKKYQAWQASGRALRPEQVQRQVQQLQQELQELGVLLGLALPLAIGEDLGL
jgi:hypothetical protein